MWKKPSSTSGFAALLALLSMTGAAHAGDLCDPNTFGTPATTVPQFRTEAPGQSLWPLDPITGGTLFKPASEISGLRDSTNYDTTTTPGAQGGTELFQDVAVLDDNDDWLFTVYNAGVQAWDLRANPADPDRAAWRDGWTGHIEHFPSPGEGDTYADNIDAVTAADGKIFVAIGGRSGHGLSIWRFNPSNQTFTQIFQDATKWIRDVEMVTHSNGRTYAFASDSDATNGGLHVYDVTTANSSPCFDDPELPNFCTAVYEGKVGNMINGGYLDSLQIGNDTYIVAADGSPSAQDRLKVEIWHVTNPESPASPPSGGSILKFDGLGDNSRGVQLFEQDGDYFLAVIDLINFSAPPKLRIYDVSNCLDSNGCGSNAGPVLFETSLPAISANFQYLTHSDSNDGSFLYFGLESTGGEGTRLEGLFDVSALTGGGSIFEVTDAGANYIDPCNGDVVDYWGDYKGGNTYGLDNQGPRHGIFVGKYFYRAALGILDIHELVQSSSQASITVSSDPDPLWMDESISFGTVVLGCQPGVTGWCWLVEPELGANISFTPPPTNAVTGCNVNYDGTQDFTFTCNGPGRCNDTDIGVLAWNLSCGDILDGVQNSVEVTLKDPTVEVAQASTNSPTILECQTAELTATLRGRGPVSWNWELGGEPIEGCAGSTAIDDDLSGLAPVACSWTAEQLFTEFIFSDDFEIRDCGNWSQVVGGSGTCTTLGSRAPQVVKGGESVTATFNVWDAFTSPANPLDSRDVSLDVDSIGDPSWVNPGNPVSTAINGSQATFTAAANDTGTWDWEFQDPTGGDTCSFPGVGTVSCVKQSTTGPVNAYAFPTDGTFAYRVTISNCVSPLTQTETGSVTVDAGVLPNITGFDLGTNPSTTCCGSLIFGGLKCVAGTNVEFVVTVEETDPSFGFSFDWERTSASDAGNFGSSSSPSPSGDTYTFTHVFANTGQREVFPISKAESGALSDTHEWLAGPSGEDGFGLTILPAGSTCN